MLAENKTSSFVKVESSQSKKSIRFNCDWEIEKVIAHYQKTNSNKHSYKSFLGEFAELKFIHYVTSLVNEGFEVTVVLEMGRCGFEGPRLMEKAGVNVHLVPVSKLDIPTNRKRVKTDKLDAKFLAKLDLNDTPKVWIPKRSQWDKRKLLEIRENKQGEVNRVNSRLRSFVAYCPLRPEYINKKEDARKWREKMTQLQREYPELYSDVIWEEIFDLIDLLEFKERSLNRTLTRINEIEEKERKQCLVNGETYILDELRKMKGVGEHIGRTFCWYVGDFKRFKNAKKISSYFGLVPTPYISCKTSKEMGISKSGKAMLRSMAVQLAWLWVRYQKNSSIYKKWEAYLNGRRAKKVAIIAMARELIVAIYRYVVHGVELEGVTYS